MDWRSNIDLIQKLYVAFYGRPADPGGLRYWASVIPPGTTDEKIIRILIGWFTSIEHEEARMYSTDLDATLSRIFFNAFNRDITPAEKAVIKSVDDALIYIINLNSGGSYEVFKAKVEYAKKFTSIIDPNGDGIPNDDGDKFAVTYNGVQDILKAQSLLRLVDSEVDNLEDKVKKDIFNFIAKQDDKFYKLYIEEQNIEEQNNLGQDQGGNSQQCSQGQQGGQGQQEGQGSGQECQCNFQQGEQNGGQNENIKQIIAYNVPMRIQIYSTDTIEKIVLSPGVFADVLDFKEFYIPSNPVQIVNFDAINDVIKLNEDFTTHPSSTSINVIDSPNEEIIFDVDAYDMLIVHSESIFQIKIPSGTGQGYLAYVRNNTTELYIINKFNAEDSYVSDQEMKLLAIIDAPVSENNIVFY